MIAQNPPIALRPWRQLLSCSALSLCLVGCGEQGDADDGGETSEASSAGSDSSSGDSGDSADASSTSDSADEASGEASTETGDTATDSDTDADTGSGMDMCDNYPTAANNFLLGSVIRNYELLDREEMPKPVCEFAATHDLMMFNISGGENCPPCIQEVPELEHLMETYPQVAFVQDIEFQAWNITKGSATFANLDLYHTEIETQASADYTSGASFLGYPTPVLVDLKTMQVLHQDCFQMLESCITQNLP